MKSDLEQHRDKLIFRSWHRGTREMDMLLGRFADQHIPDYDEGKLQLYEALLRNNDPDLYDWITRKTDPPANEHSDVLEDLIAFINN